MNPSELPDETLFEGALKCGSPAERAAFLNRACAGQPEQRRKLEALLAAHDQAGEFLEPTPRFRPAIKVELVPEETPGTMIGRYKLLQKIGEGGMGAVYMAEQAVPVVRKVALKIIKLGMDTKAVVARFESERQALALMDHPNIAKVLDAGATENGRPYFVMELVHGVALTEYCDKNKLSTRQRLELFIPVCHAIQHAHQKGIIHRDLKPSNVMVTLHDGVPVPKVIDFGVAKATNQRLTEKTLFTHYAQMIGTPAYMSPEQAEMSGLDIDTRSDIYSLGVLLYELLTGTTPFPAKELLSMGYGEIQKIIAEKEPPTPSTRMSTLTDEQRTVVASNRSMNASALRKVFQGDLDWIVMKCLEKDRTRRYETSNGLAADLQRHLANELISARPPTTGYLLKKLVRRNQAAFATAAVVAASLLVGIVATTWQAVRARQAESRALATVEELRGTAPAFVQQARGLVAQSKFDEAITKLDYALKLRPDVADYLVLKANLLQSQLKLTEAGEMYRRALKVDPTHERAKSNLKLTEELAASQAARGGKFSTESLAKLLWAMQTEQRSAAELLPVSQALGKEKDILLAYWLERLKDLPIAGDKPLRERLSLNESGRFDLNLTNTAINDLSPFAGMPLGVLLLNDCQALSNLEPLRALPLRALSLNNTQVRDLTPLATVTNLRWLSLENTMVSDLSGLRGLKLQVLHLTGCKDVTDLSPLAGMPLKELRLRSTRVASLVPLRGMPLKMLDVTFIPARDFEALSGVPLESLWLQDVRVSDLSFLNGMPLQRLSLWNSAEARNYAVLSGLESLQVLLLPGNVLALPETELQAIDSLQRHPMLQQIANDIGAGFYLDTLAVPKEQFWRKWKADRAMARGRYAEARPLLAATLEESIKSFGDSHRSTSRATLKLATCEAYLGNFRSSAKLLRADLEAQARTNGPLGQSSEVGHWLALAAVVVADGDTEAYRNVCAATFQRFEDIPDTSPALAEAMIKLWSLLPSSGIDDFVLQRFERKAKAGIRDWYKTSVALMYYRSGRLEDAKLLLSDTFTWDWAARYRDLLLAMIDSKQGNRAEAQKLLASIRQREIATWPPIPRDAHGDLWDSLILHLLLNEATQMIEGMATAPTRVP